MRFLLMFLFIFFFWSAVGCFNRVLYFIERKRIDVEELLYFLLFIVVAILCFVGAYGDS
jgi:hypothetical protein